MKSDSPKTFILAIVLIGLAVGVVWVILGQYQDRGGSRKSGQVSRAVPVEVAQIQRGPIALERTFSGELEALAEFVVAPKVSGRVERVLVKWPEPSCRKLKAPWKLQIANLNAPSRF
jgi:multidrug efflux pump subunit AcrA (membrane-fusion protein)